MKGMVGLAIILLGIGIVYVLVKRPSMAPKMVTGPSTSNQLFPVIGNAVSNILSGFSSGNKFGAPSGVNGSTQPIINEGTYLPSSANLEQEGNTLVNTDTGNAVVYGTD